MLEINWNKILNPKCRFITFTMVIVKFAGITTALKKQFCKDSYMSYYCKLSNSKPAVVFFYFYFFLNHHPSPLLSQCLPLIDHQMAFYFVFFYLFFYLFFLFWCLIPPSSKFLFCFCESAFLFLSDCNLQEIFLLFSSFCNLLLISMNTNLSLNLARLPSSSKITPFFTFKMHLTANTLPLPVFKL